MINHGFPNLSVTKLSGEVHFYALEAINKGDTICFNYGRGQEALRQHAELRYESVKQFAPSESAKWYYIIKNPSVTLLLYLDGLLTVENIKILYSYLEAEDFEVVIPSKNDTDYVRFDKILLDGIANFGDKLEQLKGKDPELFQKISDYFYKTSL